MKKYLLVLLLAFSFVAASCGENTEGAPIVTVSLDRVPDQGNLDLKGTGFTPNQNVTSHLLKPDGTEFPFLPILTDGNGEFTHEIESLLLDAGTHELWVVDDATNVTSNVARFEVTREQSPVQ
jgi:hypothetical protein